MEPLPPQFLDVPMLLESSQPRNRNNWFWYVAGGFFVTVLLCTWVGSSVPQMRPLVEAFSLLMMFAVFAVMGVFTFVVVRQQRGRQQQLEAVEELIQLRRWPQAAMLLDRILMEPARSLNTRFQALLYLSSVLARYGRYQDAIVVQNHLLDQISPEGPTAHGLRLGRAMAMLHEDQLLDADRAIVELRRSGGEFSGGLALVEIYRDVKTGHPNEAVAMFEKKLPLMREQLGHRVADAYALVARAYDMLGRAADAQSAYTTATLLAPPIELQRRYPEISPVVQKYSPTVAPPEAA